MPLGPRDKDLAWVIGDILPVTAEVASQCKRLTDCVGGSFLLVAAEDMHKLFTDVNTWVALVMVCDVRGAIALRGIKGNNFICAAQAVALDAQRATKAGVRAVPPSGVLSNTCKRE